MERDDDWLSTSEAGIILGLSDDSVRRLIHARHLRATAITVGRHTTFRIRRRDLRVFVRGHVRDTFEDDWE